MTVTLSSAGTIELAGDCPAEDAEILLRYLTSAPHTAVDWSACESAHSAVVQVLLIAKVRPQGSPSSQFLREHIGPLFLLREGT